MDSTVYSIFRKRCVGILEICDINSYGCRDPQVLVSKKVVDFCVEVGKQNILSGIVRVTAAMTSNVWMEIFLCLRGTCFDADVVWIEGDIQHII